MFISLISGGGGYLDGARSLAVSLRDHDPQIPRLLLVEAEAYTDSQIEAAKAAGWGIRVVDPIRPPPCEFKAERWPRTFTKLHAFGVDTDMAIFIDADCLVMQPVWQAIINRQFDQIAACWVRKGGDRFNSGVMAIRPRQSLYEDLRSDIETSHPDKTDAAGSDQSFLNLRFPSWTQIPDRFNYRWWAREPKNLAIAHIRPHPWVVDAASPPARDVVMQQWADALARSE